MTLVTYAKRVGDSFEWVNKHQIKEFLNEEGNKDYKGEYVVEIKRLRKVRTGKQNDALHKYFELLANKLNEGGINVQLFLRQVIDLEWTPNLIKEILWRPIQIALTEKTSTTELDKVSEIDLIHDYINRHLAEKFHLEYVKFPHKQAINVDNSEYPTDNNQTKL